ncbi:hypothetical protein D5018_13250 [Parashewanella curva]|uniref:Uncharacterized protein n=1 Tax=Parashewanella curva TaxID=2338552 RepID=A0A3L8PYT2_9GAMM|nr:hypothetical protein [Parashewanella curva]RLV59242.1 hypothetical protein D5018_13250 [Parashewanella curva]
MSRSLINIARSMLVILAAVFSISVMAGTPQQNKDGVTVIYLDQHGGHFTAKDTLAGLKEGKYQFVITNKADKLVGFQLQHHKSHQLLDMFPLEPGETKRSDVVTVTEAGVRFRCPINPTPWYDLDVIN